MKLSDPMKKLLNTAPVEWADMGYFLSPTNGTVQALLKRGLIETRLVGYENGRPSLEDWLSNKWQWRLVPDKQQPTRDSSADA